MPVRNPTITEVRDEGTTQGQVTAFDFTGSGVTASVSGNLATVNIPAGAGIGGSGTTDRYAKFTSSSAIGDSASFESPGFYISLGRSGLDTGHQVYIGEGGTVSPAPTDVHFTATGGTG